MTQPVATKVNPWEKARAVGSIVAAVLIPLVVLVATNQYNSAAQKRDQNARYIELAIGILQEEPDEESEAVRQWAVDVVNKYSEVKLPEPVRAQLLTRRIRSEHVRLFQERAGLTPDGFAGPATMANLKDEIRQLLRAGEKTAAIKRCRQVLSLGLKDCKDRVAAIEAAMQDPWVPRAVPRATHMEKDRLASPVSCEPEVAHVYSALGYQGKGPIRRSVISLSVFISSQSS